MGDHILGAFISYDVRRFENGNQFHKMAMGGEWLREAWDSRANIYLPLTGAKSAPGNADIVLSGSNIFMIGGQETPLFGVDAETGGRLVANGAAELWGFLGAYYFESPDRQIAFDYYGPQARAELRVGDPFGRMGSRLTLAASAQWDEARGNQFQLGARLRFALGSEGKERGGISANSDPLNARFSERIYRDPDIVLGDSGPERVADALTSVEFDRVVLASSFGHSDDLAADVASANRDGTLLIIDQDYQGPQVIGDAERITIAGQGSSLAVRGLQSGVTIDYLVPGDRRTIRAVTSGDRDLTALTIEGPNIGEKVHLVGLDVFAENTSMIDNAPHSGIDGVQLSAIDINKVNNPNRTIYLEDITAEASGSLPASNRGYWAKLYGLRANFSFLEIYDSRLSAELTGGSDGFLANPFVAGMHAYFSTVSINDSTLNARFYGNAAGATGDYNWAHLSGISTNSSRVKITRSTLGAHLYRGLAGGYPWRHSKAFIHGLDAQSSSVTIADSTILAAFVGDLAKALPYSASIELNALRYGAKFGGPPRNLSVTNTVLKVQRDGSDAGNVHSTYQGLWLRETSVPLQVLLLDSVFEGVFDNPIQISDSDYIFAPASTGNSALGATYVTACADNGGAWSGGFQLDGTVYEFLNC